MTANTDLKSALGQLKETLEFYLVNKAPAIPSEWKELIVKLVPYFAIVMFIITLPAVLAVFGLGAIIMPFSYLGGMRYGFNYLGFNYIIALALSAVILVLETIAIPGLFKRAEKSWRLLYYATLIGAVQNIATFNIGGLIIGTGISLYLLFQIKEYYR